MVESNDILISVEERYATSMLNGEKTVELRRRAIRVASGSRVWIYSKIPRGYIEAFGTVDQVISDTPDIIWKKYGDKSAITLREFQDYFEKNKIGHAILFREIVRLKSVLSLEDIRNRVGLFQPPQFFKRLKKGSPELTYFYSAISN